MNKLFSLPLILLALSLMSFNCEKEDPVVPEQTLEELYPEWSDLQWVSTDGVTAQMNTDVYPRLEITIVENVVSFHQPIDADDGAYNAEFTKITINGNVITFNDNTFVEVSGTFSESGGQISFTTFGLMNTDYPENEHTYVLH